MVFENVEELHATDRRRSTRHRRELRHGAQGRGAEGLSGLCGSRQHAAAEEGAAKRHYGHGARLRWPHERHGLRRGGAACIAGSGRGRAARVRADRRHDRTRRRRSPSAPGRHRRRTRASPRGLAAASVADARLLQALRRPRAASRPGRGSGLSGWIERRAGAARLALTRS